MYNMDLYNIFYFMNEIMILFYGFIHCKSICYAFHHLFFFFCRNQFMSVLLSNEFVLYIEIECALGTVSIAINIVSHTNISIPHGKLLHVYTLI